MRGGLGFCVVMETIPVVGNGGQKPCGHLLLQLPPPPLHTQTHFPPTTLPQAEVFFWALGRHLGVTGAQDNSGGLLGHVRDTGAEPTRERQYKTRANLAPHCDAAGVGGLLAVRSARAGGLSRPVSAVTVVNEGRHLSTTTTRLSVGKPQTCIAFASAAPLSGAVVDLRSAGTNTMCPDVCETSGNPMILQ